MAKYNTNNPPPRILFIDPVNGGSTFTNWSWSSCYAYFIALGCDVEIMNQYTTPVTSELFNNEWDLVVIPHIGLITSTYTQLIITLSQFKQDSFPIYYQQAYQPHSTNGKILSGATAVAAGIGEQRSTAGLINWLDRKAGAISYYGTPITAAGAAAVTPHMVSDGTGDVFLWSFNYGNHPTLWQAGYNSTNGKVTKPFQGAQFMIDNAPSDIRTNQLRGYMRKRSCKLRLDMGGKNDDQASLDAGDLDAVYTKLREYNIREVWLAFIWGGAQYADLPDSFNPEVVNWFLDRSEKSISDGALFRLMNHEVDVVNGLISYSGDVERCTTDNVTPDNFKSADTVWRTICNQITTLGFTLGKDGYGKGYPNIQDGNDMNNPAAKFLADNEGVFDTDGYYGGFDHSILMINGDQIADKYPSGAPNATNVFDPIPWFNAWSMLFFQQDGISSTSVNDMSINWNQDILHAMIYNGGIYYHGGAANFKLYDHITEYCQLFSTCPDVVANELMESSINTLKKGSGSWFSD